MIVTFLILSMLTGFTADILAAEPIVELLFDGNVDNTGTAGGTAELFEVSGMAPGFAADGLDGSYCLDNTSASSMAGDGGTVRFLSNSAVSAALTDLRSFTITGWMKSDQTPDNLAGIVAFASGDGNFRVRFTAPNQLGLQLNNTYYHSDSIANFSAANWKYFAVSYDGTTSTDNLKFYYASNDGTGIITLDSTQNCPEGQIVMDPALFYVGNVNTAGTSPFDGYLDSVRIFGSKTDNSGCLSQAEIAQYKNRNSLAPKPLDEMLIVDCRFEQNTVSEGHYIDIIAMRDTDYRRDFPEFTAGGVDGGYCLDMTMADFMGGRGPFLYHNDIGGLNYRLSGAQSFTVMGWIKSPQNPGNGARLVSFDDVDGFEVYFDSTNRLAVSVGTTVSYSHPAGNYGCPDWKFFAVSYNSTSTNNNLRFYYGSDDGTENVLLDSVASLAAGPVSSLVGALQIANRGTIYPFYGYIDSLKVFASTFDGAGALTAEQIGSYKNRHTTAIDFPDPPSTVNKSDVAIMRTSSAYPVFGFNANRVCWNYDVKEGIVSGFEALGVAASNTFNTPGDSYYRDGDFTHGKNYTNDPTLPSRARDFDGNIIEKRDHTHLYPAVSSTAFQDDIFGRVNDFFLPLKPYNVQFDTPMSNRHALALNYGIGFHDETRAAFREYLDENYSDAYLLSEHNIADIDTFDYRDWLISEYGVVDNNDYVARFDTFSLATDFEEFLETEIINTFIALRDTLHNAPRPAMLSANMGHFRWYNRGLVPIVDFIQLEMGMGDIAGVLDENDSMLCKMATAWSKPIIGVNSCHQSNYIKTNNKPGFMRCLFAAVYANGHCLEVPWNIWSCEGRYYGDPEQDGYFYRFVGDNKELFDDYETFAQIALLWNCDDEDYDQLGPACDDLFRLNIPYDLVTLGDRYPQSSFNPNEVAANYDQVVRISEVSSWSAANQGIVNDLTGQMTVVTNAASLTLSDDLIDVSGANAPAEVWVLPRTHAEDINAPVIVHILNRTYDENIDGVDDSGCTIELHRRIFDNRALAAVIWTGPDTPAQPVPVEVTTTGYKITLPETPIWSILKVEYTQVDHPDLNLDLFVNLQDIVLFAQQWNLCNLPDQPGCVSGLLSCDITGDGYVNAEDLKIISDSWLDSYIGD